MKIFSNALPLLLASAAFTTSRANADDSLDPAFSAGLATLKQASGFIENPRSSTDWKPNLQLLVGVKAVEGAKRTIYFVQLTTLPPTNSGPWQPTYRTNDWAWSATNKAQFISTLYPVRVRVFDEAGKQLKEGQTPMAWGMLTNGLMDMCRLGFESYHPTHQNDHLLTSSSEGKESDAPKLLDNDELMRATGGGFLWMFGMFYDLQTVPAVANVWAKAQCAIRWPNAWTIAKSIFTGFNLSIEPSLKDVTLANETITAEPLYRLPVDLKSSKRHLTRVEIIVGPAHGANMLLAGIRSIHAVHPTKPKQEFLAQVLAVGAVEEK